jgi:hypothetical protein
MADRRRHAPHLAIAALGHDDLDPARRNGLAHAYRRIARPQRRLRNASRLGRARESVAQPQAAAQGGERGIRRDALDLHPIGLRQLKARIGESLLEPAVVGEQHQSFAVAIEPPGRIHAAQRNVIGERGAPARIRELRQNVVRLVERYERHVDA